MTVAAQLAAYPHMAGECGFVQIGCWRHVSIAYLERCFEAEYGTRILTDNAGEWVDE